MYTHTGLFQCFSTLYFFILNSQGRNVITLGRILASADGLPYPPIEGEEIVRVELNISGGDKETIHLWST